MTAGSDAEPTLQSTPQGAALVFAAAGPSGTHDASLSFKFQMHTKKRMLLKMFCFVFLSQHVSSFPSYYA